MEEQKPRVGMGDGLSQYMAAANETIQELQAAADSPFVRVLLQFDAYFRRDLWEHVSLKPSFAILLFLNAYQLFLAGARMGLSGHPAAVLPLQRTALESASYGLLLEREPALSEIWANRHRSDADKKACRRAFTFERAIAGLKGKADNIHQAAQEAYEDAIDYGAHPNVKGVLGHVSFDETRTDGFNAVSHSSLYGANHHETIRGLCACLDYGFLIISIIALAGPKLSERLQTELQVLNDAKEAAVAEYQSAA